ncbi:alpha/beta hydrolase [Mycobacterium sp. CBMA 234]|nr:alpha/beta hydrolase [Mycolicibacterium sp. CBMA 234]
MVAMRRHLLPVLSLSTVVLVAGCAPLLAANPRYATDSGARPQGVVTTTKAPEGPAPIAAPKKDLSWHECTSRVFGDAAVPAVPGVTLDCSDYDADLDSLGGSAGTVSIGVVRARLAGTPADAGPIVMTTGSDIATSRQLPVWLQRGGVDLLRAHPVVAVDRRGMGMSSPLSCVSANDHQDLLDQAQFMAGDDQVANLATVATSATTNCTDTIAPGESAYDNAHSAEDLERLRSTWDVPALAVLGIGNGAQVALAYASSHPTKVARLVLDSPLPLGVSAEAAAEQRVKGQQAALDTFAAQCVANNCPLGPDPKGAINGMLADARAGRGAGGASTAGLIETITTGLGYPRGDGLANTMALAGALATARSGDPTALNALGAIAEQTRQTDGQFVNRCDDSTNRPTPDRVRELVVAWPKKYPQFGAVGALSLAQCLSWPSSPAPQAPKELKVPIMLLGTFNDPIIGGDGVAAVAAMAINAGTNSRRVMWQGIGHGTVIYTPCALPPVQAYLNTGKLPDTDTYCPA